MTAERYVSNPEAARRSYVADAPKTWTAKEDRTAHAVISAIKAENPRFGDALALQRLFGLRSKESLLLRPHMADKGNVLFVTHGTKGARPLRRNWHARTTPIIRHAQKLYPPKRKPRAARHDLRAVQEPEITTRSANTASAAGKAWPTTVFGTKHLNELYQKTTGHLPPCRAGASARPTKPSTAMAATLWRSGQATAASLSPRPTSAASWKVAWP